MVTAIVSASGEPLSVSDGIGTIDSQQQQQQQQQKDIRRIRAANWNGKIPVVVSLAPTSLSSPTMPPPRHVLVSRHTYLHVGLAEVVQRLHAFAPTTTYFGNGAGGPMRVVVEAEPPDDDDDDDDKNSEKDSKKSEERDGKSAGEDGNSSADSAVQDTYKYPTCWFEDEITKQPLRWQIFAGVLYDSTVLASQSNNNTGDEIHDHLLPWRIRLHFNNYPTNQLLSLTDNNFDVWTTLQFTYKHSLKQALVLQHGNNKIALNMTKNSHGRLWDSVATGRYDEDDNEHNHGDDITQLQAIPVRLLLGRSKPPIQKYCTDLSLTLDGLLKVWLPSSPTDHLRVRVAGIEPPLSSMLVDLWQALSHPDRFLYIVVASS